MAPDAGPCKTIEAGKAHRLHHRSYRSSDRSDRSSCCELPKMQSGRECTCSRENNPYQRYQHLDRQPESKVYVVLQRCCSSPFRGCHTSTFVAISSSSGTDRCRPAHVVAAW